MDSVPEWPQVDEFVFPSGINNQYEAYIITCKGHDTVVSLSAGDDKKPAEA